MKRTNSRGVMSRSLPKAPSGINGFDDITGGGFPRGRPTLICGSAGCGKTLMAMEFFMRGATLHDERGVFMAFEETEEELTQNVRSLGFDLDDLVSQKKLVVDFVRVERHEIEETGDYDLEGLFVRLGHAIDSIGAKRVVLDTIEALFSGLSNAAWNAGAERLFGYREGEVVGQPVLMLIPPNRVDEEPRILERIGRGERIEHYETVRRRKDGTLLDVSLTVSPIMNAYGQIIGASKIARDISEPKQAQETLRTSEERLRVFASQLEQRVAERTQELAQSEDHLRTLAKELNLAEQRERKRLATELHDHLRQMLVLGRLTIGQSKRVAAVVPAVEQILKKMDDIFSDSLTYTRTLVADLSPTVLRDHGLAAALQWLGTYMRKYNQTVTVTVPGDEDLKLPEDQVILLFQSVRELLINSSKYAGTGQAKVTIEQRDGLLRIDVRDEGAGFDLAAAGTPSGGISSKFGLFSIRERMRALGGSFEIESALGQGTTATLMLPLGGEAAARTEDSELRTELSGKNSALNTQDSALPGRSVLSTLASALQQDTKRIRVLLVDDHTMVRQGLKAVLDGYADIELVGEVGSGEEAVRLVDQLRPDVVVMDINMPKMNGIKATVEIKARSPETVVVGLSVDAVGDHQQAMLRAGAIRFMTKEAAVEQLYDAIQREVKKRAVMRNEGER
ncbi:MAG: response regulator [Nitrospira sp.]|nr:response regulator [Nitrospira sp.]